MHAVLLMVDTTVVVDAKVQRFVDVWSSKGTDFRRICVMRGNCGAGCTTTPGDLGTTVV